MILKRKIMINLLKKIYNFVSYLKVPSQIKKNYIFLSDTYKGDIKTGLLENYYIKDTDINQTDLEDHITGRIFVSRTKIIPWLSKEVGLKDKKLLEIGSGTGSSSVTFAEQGAIVTGIDIDNASLEVARIRAELLNLDIKYSKFSATEIKNLKEQYDIIIYYATLEHMTTEERIDSLKQAWNALKYKGHLIVVEAPNRLWIEDTHTSELPFFQWLPDDLAYLYSIKSNKQSFNSKYLDNEYLYMKQFLRRGRGVSFHEFELAFENLDKLQILGSLNRLVFSKGLINTFIYKKIYKMYISKFVKHHKAFTEEYLDLIIVKD